MKLPALIILLTITVGNCQFYYNYDQSQEDEPQPETHNHDTSAYQYNPPSAVNRQFIQPTNDETSSENAYGRARIRVRSRNYQSEPQQEGVPEAESDIDHRAIRQEKRQARRRQRQRQRELIYVQPPSPVIYSPSVFENIGLGEAPNGVYVPQDSLLNTLRSPSRIVQSTPNVVQPLVAPEISVQPADNYLNNVRQHGFFVQPPSTEEYRQPNLILPATSARSVGQYSESNSQRAEPVPATQGNRRRTPKARQPEYPSAPVVDIDSYRQYTDDISREDIQIMPQVEYAPPPTRRQERRQNQNRRRQGSNYLQTTPAPRVYSPSVFEKISLGEAPSGIYVPQDSLLNTLRNPSTSQRTLPRAVRQEAQQLPVQQPTHNQAIESDYLSESIEEPERQALAPPPPPTPPRRYSQRSRPAQTSRRSERRQQQPSHRDQTAVQSVQPSSQRRSQRRNEDYDDYLRVQPQNRQEAPPPRRQQTAPRAQSQTSSSNGGQSFRKANLAIAELPLDTDDDGIPGEAGVNYPTLHVIPKTSFSCSQQPHNGYYADLETSCQVVHLCQSRGVQDSFLCPNGTIFSQEKFSCQWWYKVNCNDAPKFYEKNDELYKVPEKKERKRN